MAASPNAKDTPTIQPSSDIRADVEYTEKEPLFSLVSASSSAPTLFMGKGHLTALDVAASAKELSLALAGCRLTNVYDLNPRTYMFKFGRPGGYKAFLVVESGIRYHLTVFERETSPVPNPFCMKLRKHLRTKRLEGVRQCGFDRILQLTFATGDHTNHVFIELHSGGNIILADAALKIMSLLRPYETASTGKVAVHERYPIEQAIELKESPSIETDGTQSVSSFCTSQGLPKQLMMHCLAETKIERNSKATSDNVGMVYKKCFEIAASLRALDSPTKGYLFQKDGKKVEFSPILFQEHRQYSEIATFPTFNEAMDDFFSTLESIQKVNHSAKNEWKALSKEEKMRRDLDHRIDKLESVSERNAQLAALIEDNLDLVDGIINALRTEIASGISWAELERTIAEEKQHRLNPIASSIKAVHFKTNSVEVVLGSDQTPVEIDLGISAYANANSYYDAKKKAKSKSERTMAASEIAMKSAKVQVQKDLKKAQKIGMIGAQALQVRRRAHWFEKFQWFITSDNYLVIGGRDAQQNDIVVRRHLNATDLYFHADLHGASSVILKNPGGDDTVPERSLQEAAQFTVCHSAAWTNKAIGSAYWVRADQVSKTAPTGMYMANGAFMVRGKRNYIPCAQLLLGFTFLFRVTDDCVEAHKYERSQLNADEEFAALEDSGQIELDIVGANFDYDNRDAAEADGSLTFDEAAQESQSDAENDSDTHQSLKGEDVNNAEQADSNNNLYSEVLHPVSDTFTISEAKPAVVSFDVTSVLVHSQQGDGRDANASFNPNLFSKSQFDGGRLIAKQRRQMKKSGSGAETELHENESQELKPKSAPPAALPRGKRNKLKKMKMKYADQDAIDRQRALKLLGATVVKEFRDDVDESSNSEDQSDENPAAADTAEQEPVPEQNWIVKICFYCHSHGHVARACPQLAHLDKTTINKIVQQGQDRTREEDQQFTRDDVEENFSNSSLVGCPTAADEILYALPMCAPYSSIMNYKFKVKVIPGVDKRGTAAKSCISLCLRILQGDPDADRIQNLIKCVSDNDLAIVLPPSSKVSSVGIAAVKKGKQGKKPGRRRPKK